MTEWRNLKVESEKSGKGEMYRAIRRIAGQRCSQTYPEALLQVRSRLNRGFVVSTPTHSAQSEKSKERSEDRSG